MNAPRPAPDRAAWTHVLAASVGLTALLGVLFIISPWVMGFASTAMRMAITAWIVGGVTLVVGLADVSLTRTHQAHVTAH